MSFLIDTNVVSELIRKKADDRVVQWMRQAPAQGLFVSVLTLGEIRKGIESLEPGPRRERLRIWLETLLPRMFEGRILPVDAGVADRWGRLVAQVKRSLPAIDGLLAATALHHGLRLVTRNRVDYQLPGLEIVDPWER